MGQAKNRLNELLQTCPNCIYCGGTTLATSVDHFPARIIFDQKDRPKGWEFSACATCNSGSSHVDLIATNAARFYPDPVTEKQQTEQKKILKAIFNNIPGAIQEMQIGRGSQKIALGKLRDKHEVGLVQIGPIQQRYLDVFCQKFALAAHYEATGNILPATGVMVGIFMTNFEAIKSGDLLTYSRKYFPNFATLRQGSKHASGQFDFACEYSEDKSHTIAVARFRQSFEVYGAASSNPNDFAKINESFPGSTSSPENLKMLIQSLKSER